MKNLISELLSIDYIEGVDHEKKAYSILDKLNKTELLEIAKIDGMTWIKKSMSKNDIKNKIYDSLVYCRIERQLIKSIDLK